MEKLLHTLKTYNEAHEEALTVPYYARKLKAGSPLIQVECGFMETLVIYAPTRINLRHLFDDIINKATLLICNKHKQLLHETEFSVYAKTNDYSEDPNDEIIKMHMLVKNDDKHKFLTNKIEAELDKSFEYVEKGAENIKPLLEIYLNDHNLDMNSFRGKDLEEFKQALERFRDEDAKLHALEEVTEIGIYSLDKKKLKAKIKDCANKCLTDLQDLMPRLNYERADALVIVANNHNEKLKSFPDNVDDFVIFMRNLNTSIAQTDEMAAKLNEILELNHLLDE
jgi:putative NADPH-quinone reductase